MSDFLLIHGSAHGAWSWDFVIPHLESAGHTARAIDLPSHGQDLTPAALVTLDMYAGKIRAAMYGKTILVAHSMAGFPATLAADLSPHLIEKLVYLCAHIPEAGKSIADMRAMADAQPLAAALIPSEDGKTVTVDPDMAHKTFYHDVASDRSAWAISNLCPQPVLPQNTPYPVTSARAQPKHYIRCLDDRAIPPSYQVARTKAWPSEEITELQTSHSPFLSDPEGLAAHLSRIAES